MREAIAKGLEHRAEAVGGLFVAFAFTFVMMMIADCMPMIIASGIGTLILGGITKMLMNLEESYKEDIR